jgi:hypothetical protein
MTMPRTAPSKSRGKHRTTLVLLVVALIVPAERRLLDCCGHRGTVGQRVQATGHLG